MALVGSQWPQLALLASIGPGQPLLASIGPGRPPMDPVALVGLVGLRWPLLASLGPGRPPLALVGLAGLRWPWSAYNSTHFESTLNLDLRLCHPFISTSSGFHSTVFKSLNSSYASVKLPNIFTRFLPSLLPP